MIKAMEDDANDFVSMTTESDLRTLKRMVYKGREAPHENRRTFPQIF